MNCIYSNPSGSNLNLLEKLERRLAGSAICLCLVFLLPIQVFPSEKIVLIVCAELKKEDLGAYLNDPGITPNINRLAARGARFQNAFTSATDHAVSRWSVLTGLNPALRFQMDPVLFHCYPNDFKVLRELNQRGYKTAAIGVWGIGSGGHLLNPNRCGFNEWFGVIDTRNAHEERPALLWRNGITFPFPDKTPAGVVNNVNELYLTASLNFIDQNKDQSFLLYLAPSSFSKDPEHSLVQLDDMVGDILDRLETLGIKDQTTLFFTSNGNPDPAAGHDPGGISLRSLSVPLICYNPQSFSQAVVVPQFVGVWDIMPTLADWNGIPPDSGRDVKGSSLHPCMAGSTEPAHDHLLWRSPATPGEWQVLLDSVLGVYSDHEQSWRLFDLNEGTYEVTEFKWGKWGLRKKMHTIIQSHQARLPFAPSD